MATSPNYGWLEPDNTDLVKNGALAIRTLGNAIDTTMATMTPKSIVDAKGDLIAASAADTPARLAVGNNGETLVADSSTSTGLRYQTGYNGNGAINGGFDVWQRSTSATFAGAVTYPAADRFFGVALGSSPTCTMSRQTADTTGLTYGLRFGRNSGQTATGDVYVGSAFESIDSKRFAGQTVTFSFYVKSGANAPTSFVSQIRTGTGTDQSAATLFSTGWTGGLNNSQTNTVTTTMTRYTQTVTLGSTVNQIMLLFTYTPTGTAGANEWFQIEGVQIELGLVATNFKRSSGGTIQGELAACQRYYVRYLVQDGYAPINSYGVGFSSTGIQAVMSVPVTMRTNIASVDISGVVFQDISSGSNYNVASTSLNRASDKSAQLLFTGLSGITSYRQYTIYGNGNSAAYLGFSAEL